MGRPNIVFFYSDQHRFDCLGVNGHSVVQTPNMDRLAKEGANATSAFCPSPICVPARCSLLTGAWPSRHGTVMNFDGESYVPLDESLAVYPALLRESGYYTGHVGRWHVKEDSSPLEFGFMEHIQGGGAEEPAGPGGYAEWRAGLGLAERPETGFFGGVDPHIGPDESFMKWEADRTIEMIRKAAGQEKPFLIEWHTVAPHLPNIVPEPFASMYPPEELKPWAGFDDPLDGKPYIQSQQRRTWQVEGWKWEQWSPMVGRCLGEISLYDQQIGRVLDVLDELGLSDDTLVVYSADHGDMCGSHGMMDKHYIMYDDVVHIPLIVRLPGRVRAGQSCDAFLDNSVDLAYTFVELAGITPPDSFAGRSVIDAINGKDPNPREDIFATFVGNQFGLLSQRMVRNRRWKYVWNAVAQDELYDLQNDPGEISNLATDAGHAEQLAVMRGRLIAWMKETGDTLLNMWTEAQLAKGLTV